MVDMLNLELYKPISVGTVIFKPYSHISETLKQIEKDRMPRVTGFVEFPFNLTSDNREDLFTKAEKIIIPYGWLWSFAQNRTVFHWGISVYKIEEDGKSKFLGTVWKPVMADSVYGVSLIELGQCEQFLKTAIPLMSSDKFVNETNLLLSLHLYLDANRRGLNEITFLKNWFALETMVNAHSDMSGTEYILKNNEFKRFRRKIHNFVEDDSELDDAKKAYIINNLPGLRRYPVRQCIGDFFSSCNIDYDENDISTIKKIRDRITHTGKLPNGITLGDVVDYERKLRVLLQRSYLTLLGCNFTYSIDDRGFMHPKLAPTEN